MLGRWFFLYPLVYLEYNLLGLMKGPWRMSSGSSGSDGGTPGLQEFPPSGMIVANHTNFWMDWAVLQCAGPQWSYFLCDASLGEAPFIQWLVRFARGLAMPRRGISRQDRQQAWASLMDRLSSLLWSGQWLVLFPEGNSSDRSQLGPLRPGFAKIAFKAQEKAGWQLDLKIYPLGLNYEHRGIARSWALAHWGTPIDTASFRDLFLQDPVRAEAELVERVRFELERGLLQASSPFEKDQVWRVAHGRQAFNVPSLRQIQEDLRAGKLSSEISAQTGHKLYQWIALMLWFPLALVGWPFRIFGRLCARNPSEEPVYMLLLWFLALIAGVSAGGLRWVVWQAILTWLASSSYLWAWRRGMLDSQ